MQNIASSWSCLKQEDFSHDHTKQTQKDNNLRDAAKSEFCPKVPYRPRTCFHFPVAFALKRACYVCFLVYCRKRSSVFRGCFYSNPRMLKFIDLYRDSAVFSTVNVNSRYCQVKMENEARQKMACISNYDSIVLCRCRLDYEMRQVLFSNHEVPAFRD